MNKVKLWIVVGLERLCDMTHFITHHRPWLWWFKHCPFAGLSFRLDERWEIDHWRKG